MPRLPLQPARQPSALPPSPAQPNLARSARKCLEAPTRSKPDRFMPPLNSPIHLLPLPISPASTRQNRLAALFCSASTPIPSSPTSHQKKLSHSHTNTHVSPDEEGGCAAFSDHCRQFFYWRCPCAGAISIWSLVPTPPSQVTSSSFPPGWFASALSQAIAGSSAPGDRCADLTSGSTGAYPPPTAGMVDVLPDVEGWGRESRPPSGFVNYIKSPSNSVQLVLDRNQSQPINVDNAENEGATRTENAWHGRRMKT